MKQTGVSGRGVWRLAAAVLVFWGSSAWAQQINPATYVTNNRDGSQTLLHHMPQEVALGQAKLIVHASSNQILDLRIILPSKDQAGLDNFIQQLYNPKSPNYHKFLTPAQFALLYGASSTDFSVVLNYLKSQGFILKSQSKNGIILRVTAPVSAVEHIFNLHINNYKKSDGTAFFAPDANPTIPVPVAGKINAVIGMDNLARFRPHYHLKNPAQTQTPVAAAKTAAKTALPPAFSGYGGYLGPTDILIAYDLASLSSTGSGQTLGLFELDQYTASDITTFESYYSLRDVPLNNVYTDETAGTPGVDSVEDVLDIDLAVAVAPGLDGIIIYQAPNTLGDWVDQWNAIAEDDAASVISCSWGGYEAGFYPFYDHTVFQNLAAQGQSVFASSGDAGAYDNCDGGTLPPNCTVQGVPATGILSVDDPASDPYITGVGISVVTVNGNGTYHSETASLYGGGGISSYWNIPSFQQGLTLASGSLVSTTMRNVPDVVFTADPATSYAIYVSNSGLTPGWYPYWGSSAASPIWAAFMSRVNQGRIAGGLSAIGYLNPVIYQMLQSDPDFTNDFHDVTTGTNSFYPAKVGYDDATGLGSFDGVNLYEDLVGITASPTGLSAIAGNGQVALTWTAVSQALSYNVKRSTTNGGPYTNISTNGTVTVPSYTDNRVTNGETYYYVVSAVNLAGESSNSSQVSATPFGVPLAPTGLTILPGNNQARLNWNASNTAASYNVKRSLNNGGPYTTISSAGSVTGTTYTDNGLTNGQTYYYVVSAVNLSGESPNSVQASVVPHVVALSPTNLKVTILGAKVGNTIITGAISLTWTQSPSPGITQNKVYRAIGSGSYSVLAVLGPSTAYTDKNVNKGTTYNYEVSAVNSSGESLPSNSSTISY